MIVVDTNVVAYLFLSSPHSGQASRALLREPDWRAPQLWRSEFVNILATYLRNGRLDLQTAITILEKAQSLMQGAEYEVVSQRVLILAADSGRSAYDCEFVTLALDLNAPLITADAALLRSFPNIAVSLDTFAAGA